MDPQYIDPPKQSKCTSCIYTEDNSNYWTASIYFKSPENGTYKRVPQMANGRLNRTLLEQDGGLTVYYMKPFSGTNKKTTAFGHVSNTSFYFLPSYTKVDFTMKMIGRCWCKFLGRHDGWPGFVNRDTTLLGV